MGHSTISLGLGLGGGKAATSNGRLAGGGFANTYSVEMDATNEFIEPAGGATITLGTTDVCMSFWFKQNSAGFNYLVIDDSLNGRIYINSGSLIIHGSWGVKSVSSAVTPGNWHHLLLTRDSGTQKVYLDGVVKYTASKSTSLNVRRFAAYGTTGSYYLDGFMDEIALWESGQDANVATIYNSGVPSDISSLNPVHWWRMGETDSGTGTSVTNVGSSSTALTLKNGAAFATDVPS